MAEQHVAFPRRREALHQASISDQPATSDTLGFKPYVEALARFLLNQGTAPPLSLSVEGDWGSGKSSFMKQLKAELEQSNFGRNTNPTERAQEATATIWFNAWRHDKSEALWAAFALEFVDQIAKRMRFWERLYSAWRLARSRYDWTLGWWDALRAIAMTLLWITLAVAGLVLWFSGGWHVDDVLKNTGMGDFARTLVKAALGSSSIFGSLAAVFYVARQTNSIIGNPLRVELKKHLQGIDYTEKVAFVEKFHRDFSKIVKAYTNGRRVFVFIDDLDRCEIATAAELLQALNLMIAEESPIIFVLGLDRDKVAAGLAARAEKIIPFLAVQQSREDGVSNAVVGLEYGLAFIEKFIQLPFRVPTPRPQDIESFLARLKHTGKPLKQKLSDAKSETTIAKSKPLDTLSSDRYSSGVDSVPVTTESDGRWTGFELQVAGESETIQDLVRMVAPSLDYNARRVKQFVNVFRLKAYVCFVTGAFNPTSIEKNTITLSFEQLAKFVALTLRWPLLINDLYENPDLLRTLLADTQRETVPEKVRHWRKVERLMQLLRYRPANSPSSEDDIIDTYNMTQLNTELLLRTSPRVRALDLVDFEAIRTQTEEAEDAKASNASQSISGAVAPQKNTPFAPQSGDSAEPLLAERPPVKTVADEPRSEAAKELLEMIEKEHDATKRGIVEILEEIEPGTTMFFGRIQYGGSPYSMKSRLFREGVNELIDRGVLLPPEHNTSTNTRTYEYGKLRETSSDDLMKSLNLLRSRTRFFWKELIELSPDSNFFTTEIKGDTFEAVRVALDYLSDQGHLFYETEEAYTHSTDGGVLNISVRRITDQIKNLAKRLGPNSQGTNMEDERPNV